MTPLPLRTIFRKSRRGASAIEYGLLASLIAVAIIAGITSVSYKTKWFYIYMALVFGSVDGDGSPETPEFMSEIFPYAHGGDQQVSMTEWKDLRYSLPNFLEDHPPTDESLEEEFNWVDGRGNDDDQLNHDEWLDLLNMPEP
jgi:Flp pilus assembly pilin Flp